MIEPRTCAATTAKSKAPS